MGSPRWARILRTTMGSVSCAIRRRGPPQCGQVRTSRAKTRRRSSAHVERDERDERERAEVLGAVGELGASGAFVRSPAAARRLQVSRESLRGRLHAG